MASELLTQVYNYEETIVFPRSAEEFATCVESGVRMILTREQIEEWNVQIDIREVSQDRALELLFADDDEYYEALVFADLDSLAQPVPMVGAAAAGVGGAPAPIGPVRD